MKHTLTYKHSTLSYQQSGQGEKALLLFQGLLPSGVSTSGLRVYLNVIPIKGFRQIDIHHSNDIITSYQIQRFKCLNSL